MLHGHITIGTHIFLTGATGYIGGSVLSRLLSHPLSDTFQITVLVRDPNKAKQFRTMGIRAIVGSLEDTALLRRLASEADIVIACADADDLDAAKAILEGLKERHTRTGRVPALLHTSGTGTLIDNALGMHSTDKVYSDMDIKMIETLSVEQPHRVVDVALVEADNQGYVRSHIILPGTIYGTASGALVDLELQHPHSRQIPRLVDVSLCREQGGMIGLGKNMWPNVHIDDVAELFILLFDKLLPTDGSRHAHHSTPAHGRSGYYFCENGEHTLHSIGKAIAHAMYDLGKSKTTKPSSFTAEEMSRFFSNGASLGSNSRCKAERSKKLGWRPRNTTKDMLASIRNEVERLAQS